jgi:Flp pilus assembly protein TadG
MKLLQRRTWAWLLRETRGAEIAEAAAVLPIMFMIVLGIFWFGEAFSIYGTITRAAQEGARAAAAPNCTTCTTANTPAQNAYNAVAAALTVAHLKPNQIVPIGSGTGKWTPTNLPDCTSGTVSCTNTNNVCVQPHVLLSGTAGTGAACGVSVSFEYPYQLWLPFVTNYGIQMQAVGRVRMEAQ